MCTQVRLAALVVSVCMAMGVAHAAAPPPDGSFAYSKFAKTTGLKIVGNVVVVRDVLRLTPDVEWRSGAVWYATRVPVAAGFRTTFTFRITAADDSSADGLAFVVQNSASDALGGQGGNIGYGQCIELPNPGGIPNSLAIEFDTYPNSSVNGLFTVDDPNDNHISVHTRGAEANGSDEFYSLGSAPSVADLKDGNVHTATITYTPGTLTVLLDGAKLVVPYRFAAGGKYANGSDAPGLVLEGGTAWVGITSSTGISHSNHDILSWSFGPAQAPVAPGGPRRPSGRNAN